MNKILKKSLITIFSLFVISILAYIGFSVNNALIDNRVGARTGPTQLEDLSDVNFTNLSNGQVPIYSTTTAKWINGTVTTDLSSVVPYTGATGDVNLGTNGILFGTGTSTNKFTVNQLCFSGDGCQTATVSAGSEVTLYHYNLSSDIAGYEAFRTIPNNGTEISETATSSSGTYGIIDSYISTTTDLSFTSIPAGTWSFHYYANIDSDVGDSRMVARVYKRNLAGTETLLLTATSTELTTGLKEYQFNGFGQATTTLSTDRIVVKPYIHTDSVSVRTLTFYYDGLTNYSHVVTPFSLAVENFTRSTVNETITGTWTFNNYPSIPNLSGINTGNESTSTVGTLINGSTATTSPADTDKFSFSASSLLRHITWSNIKSTILSYISSVSSTFTNKRITPRIGSIATTTSLTIDSDSYDQYNVTALASALTINAPSGTPTIGQKLMLRITSDATPRALTFATSTGGFATSSDLALPSTTAASKTMYLGFIWNSLSSKWNLIALLNNF